MTQITTEVKGRVLMFYDGGHKFISKNQEEKFWEASYQTDQKGIKIDGDYTAFADVRRIVSQEEFFQQNPDKRPERETVDQFAQQYGNLQIRKPTNKASELLKTGFINHFLDAGETMEVAEEKYRVMKLL